MDVIKEQNSWSDKIFSKGLSIFITLSALLGLFIISVIFIVFGNWKFSTVIDEAKIGQFGDFVGGVIGTLLAFVAAILYYLALKAQREDITINQQSTKLQTEALIKQIEEFEKQKEELKLTREVYEQQSKTMAEQERTMKIQQFESNFYSLLNVYISIKNNLNNNCEHNDFFRLKYAELEELGKSLNPLPCHKTLINSYETLFHKNQGSLSHYFKTIYRLIKIVDSNNSLKDDEKLSYIKIIRSQLTDYEQLVMYYNCHSVYGEKSRMQIFKYNILKHVNPLDKIDFVVKYGVKTDFLNLIAFYNFLARFIIKSVNYLCDSIEDDKVGDEYRQLNCSISIVDSENLQILICFRNKDYYNSHNLYMFSDFIHDILFTSQFLYVNNAILSSKEIENKDGSVTFHYEVNKDLIRKINTV